MHDDPLPRKLTPFLKRLWCRITRHTLGGCVLLNSPTPSSGFRFRCKRCGTKYSQKW